jgi:hypothetical protein
VQNQHAATGLRESLSSRSGNLKLKPSSSERTKPIT